MNVQRLAAAISIAVVTIAALAGFILSGTPGEQRLKRLDERRVTDLQTLARAMDHHRRGAQPLPDTLAALVDGRNLSSLPSDPATGEPYRYERLSADGYRLCADFARPSAEWDRDNFWRHPAGPHCYTFTADGVTGSQLRPVP